MNKETPAQRMERIKEEKSGLDVLKDIYNYAIFDREIDPEDIDRFKWYGLYTQNKNLQAKDDTTQYFMLRVKLIQGFMNLEQMKVISRISQEFAKQSASFTTRQDIQFHFIQVRDLPEIFHRLESVKLSTVFAAGDVPRNIVTCPVSGIEPNEIYDTRKLVLEASNYFNNNKSLANLPRKFKVGISGCHKHCMGHEIQDLSFTAVQTKNEEVLFDVSVGGGLASNKQFAHSLGFIKAEQVLQVIQAVSLIYKDFGLRKSRKKARLGHLIKEWGIEKFKITLQEKLGFSMLQGVIQEYTSSSQREHFGAHKAKENAKSYIGCALNGGSIGASNLKNLAGILQKYGADGIRATSTQNIVVINIPTEFVESMIKDLNALSIEANPSPFKARTLSCTGIKYCKFGISETKDAAINLVKHLDKKFPNFKEKVSISLNGCPNSCAHPSIVDIGLMGTRFKDENGNTIAGFELILGGTLEGNKSKYGEKMKIKIKKEELNNTVEKIIASYIKSSKKYIGLFLKDLIHGDEFTIYKLK